MSKFDNFKTLKSKAKNNAVHLSVSDIPICPIIHHPSAPNLHMVKKIDLATPKNRLSKEASDIRFKIDNIDHEFLKEEDKQITNLDLEEENWEKLKTEMSVNKSSSKLSQTQILKSVKSPLTRTKVKPSRSLDASPLRLNKKKTPSTLKKADHKNVKIKNINKFINKPNGASKPTTIKKNINHSRSTSVSTPVRGSHTRNKSVDRPIKTMSAKQKQILHFNTNIKKSIDKAFVDLQSMFGRELNNLEGVYSNFSEEDKKNLIGGMLTFVLQMKNENKETKSKSDSMKKEVDNKSKIILALNKDIKLLKSQLLKAQKNVKAAPSTTTYSRHNRASSLVGTKKKGTDEDLRKSTPNRQRK